MKHILIKPFAMSMAITAGLALAGCKTAPPTMYQWEDYQPQVYQHFKGESPEQQIAAMEKGLLEIASRSKNPPPGYHAHLGLLYAMTDKQDLALAQFEIEKKLFPESTTYMDFLLKNTKKSEK